MRLVLAILLALSAAACRKAEAPPAAAPSPSASPSPAPAPEPAPPPAAAEPAPAPGPAAPAPAPATAAATSPPPAAAPAAPAPPPEPDRAIYRWEDADGSLHFGTVDDIPASRRRSARPVEGAAVLVDSPDAVVPAPPPPPADTPPAPAAATAGAEAGDEQPGDKPRLDASGLPIPGTMKPTAHTRAVQQATGVELDPAAVERQHQQQLRDMNCREVDGVMTCG
jgi:hypothetical protein